MASLTPGHPVCSLQRVAGLILDSYSMRQDKKMHGHHLSLFHHLRDSRPWTACYGLIVTRPPQAPVSNTWSPARDAGGETVASLGEEFSVVEVMISVR